MSFAFFLVVALATTVLGIPCYFPLEKSYLTREDALACLRSIPFDQAVAIQTVGNVLDYLKAFVFGDIIHTPPSPYEELQSDLETCVETLQRQVKESPESFQSDYDFHQALSDIFLPYRDPHTMYSKPSCYQKITWLLPIALSSKLVDGKQILFVDHLPPEYSYFEIAYWENHGGSPDGLYGEEIITLNDTEPVTFVKDWADKHVYSSKTADSRFNSALGDDFWMMGGRYYGPPDTSLKVQVETKTIEIEWGATNTISLYGPGDFESYCPVLDVPWSTEAQQAQRVRSIGEEKHLAVQHSPIKSFAEEMKRNINIGENQPNNMRSLIVTKDVSFYLYEQEEGSDDVVILVNIPSFSPNDVNSFVDNFLEGVKQSNELGITHLIVNLMGNGGGWVTLGYRVLRVIAPWIYPLYGEYNIRHSPLSELLLSSALAENIQTHLKPDTMEPYGGSSWYTNGVSKEWTNYKTCGLGGETGEHYSWNYSQRYSFTVAYDEHDFVDAFSRLDNSNGFIYSKGLDGEGLPPQNIIFLSDGLCGSTCACTSKRAQEAHAGIIVGVGGVYGVDAKEMDVASFAGGSVSDNTYIEAFLKPDDYSTSSHIPFPMPTNAIFRFAFEEVYGWNDKETPLEFNLNSVDLKLPYWPKAGSRWLEDAGELVKRCIDEVFSLYSLNGNSETQHCLPWMVTPNNACSIENGFGGYQCREDGNGYDTTGPCLVGTCKQGYYRSSDKLSCIAFPSPNETKTTLSAGAIAAIVISIILVIALVIIAVLIQKNIISCSRDKKDKDKLLEDKDSSSSN